jgi:hypothetical protein
MKSLFIRLGAVVLLALYLNVGNAQPDKKEIKPYKILTSGKQVTVKSSRNIRNIMVWTASGHRIIEQKDINTSTYTFSVASAREKAFFLMIQYETGKPFTEKIGVR